MEPSSPPAVHWSEKGVGLSEGYLDEMVLDFVLRSAGKTPLVPEVLEMYLMLEMGAFSPEEQVATAVAIVDLIGPIDIPGPIDEMASVAWIYSLYQENITPEVTAAANAILRRDAASGGSVDNLAGAVGMMTMLQFFGKPKPKQLKDPMRQAADAEVNDLLERANRIYNHPVP